MRNSISESVDRACKDLNKIELRNKIHFNLIKQGNDEIQSINVEKNKESLKLKWKAPYKAPIILNSKSK